MNNGLVAAVAALSLVGACVKGPPDYPVFGVHWHFSQPAPADPKAFIEAVRKYNKDITAEAGFITRALNYLWRARLDEDTGLQRLRVKYEYAVELPSGEWQHIESAVEIQASSGTLTAGEILYWIHQKTQHHLDGQDHSFFEDLTLAEEQHDDIPTYELFLGG
jgi:hypothetical protein